MTIILYNRHFNLKSTVGLQAEIKGVFFNGSMLYIFFSYLLPGGQSNRWPELASVWTEVRSHGFL